VQCLYCETELKALRGLFDEDFCCKDHREKYFASFRKGINLLPVLDLAPIAPTQDSASQGEEVEVAMQEQQWVPQLERAVEAVAQEPEPEVPATFVALVAESSADPVLVAAAPAEAAEELLPVESSEPAALAVAGELLEAWPVQEIDSHVSEIAVQALEPPVEEQPVDEAVAVAASIEAALDDDGYEEAAVAPPAADFLHLHVAPFGVADCFFMIDQDSFSPCNGPAIPDVEVFCDAAFDPEERLAHLPAPAGMVSEGPVSSATGRAAAAAEPLVEAVPQFVRASIHAWDYATPSIPALGVAELVEHAEIFAAVAISPQMARSANSAPLPPASITVIPPAFHASTGGTEPSVSQPMHLELVCRQTDGAPLMFSDMTPEVPLQTLPFQASAEAMQMDEDLKRAIEPPKTEAARLAEPEIARPTVMSAAPVSRAVSTAAFHPPTAANPARAEAQLNVPAMSSKTEAIPGLASEVLPDLPRGAAAETPPPARSSEPVQPAIENSARIKNWRLKITFAKPA
jgi:hypothetical protein